MIRPNMKSSVFCLGLAIVLACSVNADPQCHTSEIMQCVNIAIEWLHTLPKGSIAATNEQFDSMCQEFGKAVDCALKYRDSCTTPLQKEIFGLVLEGFFNFRKDFCPSGSAMRTKFLSNAECLNKASQTDNLREIVENMLVGAENLPKQENKNKIMYFCCGYRKFYHGIVKNGVDTCGKESMDVFLEFIHIFTAQLLEVVCNNVDGSEDSCQALLPPAGSKVSDDAKTTLFYQFLRNAFSTWVD